MKTPAERLLRSYTINSSTNCWEWNKSFQGGYRGQIRVAGKNVKAHRLSYEVHHGPIPKGICVLHRCDNPKCINPDHLFLGTQKDNTQDMLAKQRGLIGEKNGASKLTKADVLAIRAMAGTVSDRSIARYFQVNPSTILEIRRREIWRHV